MKTKNPRAGEKRKGWNVHGNEQPGSTKTRPTIQANDAEKLRLQVRQWAVELAVRT